MEHPNPKEKWKNMRRMAWTAFLHALTAPLYLDGDVLIAMMTFDGTVISAYMGLSTARDGWGKQ